MTSFVAIISILLLNIHYVDGVPSTTIDDPFRNETTSNPTSDATTTPLTTFMSDSNSAMDINSCEYYIWRMDISFYVSYINKATGFNYYYLYESQIKSIIDSAFTNAITEYVEWRDDLCFSTPLDGIVTGSRTYNSYTQSYYGSDSAIIEFDDTLYHLLFAAEFFNSSHFKQTFQDTITKTIIDLRMLGNASNVLGTDITTLNNPYSVYYLYNSQYGYCSSWHLHFAVPMTMEVTLDIDISGDHKDESYQHQYIFVGDLMNRFVQISKST